MTHAALLLNQLAEALDDGDALEIAALAGSLARFGGHLVPVPALSRCADLTVEALVDAITMAVDDFVDAEEGDEPEETWGVLCALDELCAAAIWLGFGRAAINVVDLAVRVVLAFPEPWMAHAEEAAALLDACAPLDQDPSFPLWRAIAGAREASSDQIAGL